MASKATRSQKPKNPTGLPVLLSAEEEEGATVGGGRNSALLGDDHADFDAPIAGISRFRVTLHSGMIRAIAVGEESGRRKAQAGQILTHSERAAFAEGAVIFGSAPDIGVTREEEGMTGVVFKPSRDFVKLAAFGGGNS